MHPNISGHYLVECIALASKHLKPLGAFTFLEPEVDDDLPQLFRREPFAIDSLVFALPPLQLKFLV